MRAAALAASLVISSVLVANPARADSIDGAWCRDAGLRMMISGPTIVTPAGTRTQGDYSRHAFSYVVPSSDPGAGGKVEMRLLSEEEVQVRGGPQGQAETWRRCGPPIS